MLVRCESEFVMFNDVNASVSIPESVKQSADLNVVGVKVQFPLATVSGVMELEVS